MSSTSPTLSAAENETGNTQRELRHVESTAERPPTLPHHADLAVSHRPYPTASTTHRLPMEILSLIFQHCSPPLPPFMDAYDMNRLFHLTLRSVSSHWHHVVQSTPQLWTRIISLRKYVNEDFGWYLKLCLGNSGRLPLTIRLTFRISQSDSPYLVSPLVDDILRCNLYRIRILELHGAHILWLTEIPVMFELTSLRLMRMNANERGTGASSITSLNLSKNTKINDLSFFSLFIDDVKLGPSTSLVTQLDLKSIPIDICIRLYLECRRVKTFRCSSPRKPQSLAVPKTPTHTLERDSLSSLSWGLLIGNLTHWNNYVLKWTHFPALKGLWWTDSRYYPGAEYDPTEFFSRLPQSLDEITFSYIRPSAIFHETPIDNIRPDAHVSNIVLQACSEGFLNNVFQSLFKKTTAGGEEVVPFPRLVYVSASIFIFLARHPFSSVVGKNLVQLLEERKDIITEFTFCYSSYFNDLNNWEAETWRRLDKLRDGGLTINILGT